MVTKIVIITTFFAVFWGIILIALNKVWPVFDSWFNFLGYFTPEQIIMVFFLIACVIIAFAIDIFF